MSCRSRQLWLCNFEPCLTGLGCICRLVLGELIARLALLWHLYDHGAVLYQAGIQRSGAVSRSAAFGDDLDRWLTPFLEAMGRSTRRRWGPVYVRGLLGPDGPKSVQPIATRLGLRGHDQLHHFISSPAWDDAPLWRVLAEKAHAVVGGDDAVLVVDDTALPKKGTRSVGVAPQYCGELGKQANCRSLVSLTLAHGEVPVMIGLRLFLPEIWTEDPVALS